MEVWKVLNEFPKYSVSSEGRVRNDHLRRLLTITENQYGVAKVALVSVSGRQQTRALKLLVAEAFVPGRTDTFDTPITLDGNPRNVLPDNLVWRPRWFAIKYTMQMNRPEKYWNVGPAVHRETGTVYETVYHAGVDRGFLIKDVLYSVYNHQAVFPFWEHFDFPPDAEE